MSDLRASAYRSEPDVADEIAGGHLLTHCGQKVFPAIQLSWLAETLSSIAVAHYGNIANWERIYQANRTAIGANPHALKVGMKLVIPPGP